MMMYSLNICIAPDHSSYCGRESAEYQTQKLLWVDDVTLHP